MYSLGKLQKLGGVMCVHQVIYIHVLLGRVPLSLPIFLLDRYFTGITCYLYTMTVWLRVGTDSPSVLYSELLLI